MIVQGVKPGRKRLVLNEHNVPSPEELKIEVLHEQPNLCAWVGKRAADGKVVDAVPFFLESETGEPLNPVNVGVVLLVDIARDIAVANRYGNHNFAMTSQGALSGHILDTYGKETLEHLLYEFTTRSVQPESNRFLAKRLARVLKVNYLDAATEIRADGGRVRLEDPPTTLTKLETGVRLKTLPDLALWLGMRWLEAEQNLLRKRPDLRDRSKFFQVTEDEAIQPAQ